MGLISILIVTYNSENEISDCIKSILDTSKDIDFDILIADNNSYDNTISKIEEFNSPQIKLFKNNKNVGYTKANNQCINIANGEHILFLNPDTILQKESLKILINEISNDKELGAVAPQLKFPNKLIQKSCRRFPRRRDIFYEAFGLNKIFTKSIEFNHWKMGDFNHRTSRFVEQPAGAALLIKKQIIDEIGMLDEQFPMFFSDVDLCKRIWNAGYKIKYTTHANFIHHGGRSIYRNRIKMIISSHLSFLKYFNKYKEKPIDSIFNIIIGILLIILIPIRIIFKCLFSDFPSNRRQTL